LNTWTLRLFSRFLGTLFAITLIDKWCLISHLWPARAEVAAFVGSGLVGIYMFGSLIGALGLFYRKWWGCIAAYGAVLGATMIGVSVIPGLGKMPSGGLTHTYAVLVLNTFVIAGIAFVQRHTRKARNLP